MKYALQVIQSSLVEWWYSWLSLTVLNLLLVLCWITVILGPPATFGFYYAVDSLLKTHSTDWRELMTGARRYFFQSWLWMLMNVIAVILVRVSVEFYSQFAETTVFLFLVVVTGAVWFGTQFYALPYFMQQEQKQLRVALRNGLLTLLASPLYTVILMLVVLAAVWLSLSFPMALLIGTPSLIVMLGTQAVRERLRTFKIVNGEEGTNHGDAEETG